jgi:DNA-nicking Smr family endonuclease
MPRRRATTREEAALFERAMRGTRRLDGMDEPPEPPPPAPAADQPAARAREPVRRGGPTPGPRALDPRRPVDLDRRTWLRLRRGLLEIEARLDLHGDTQEAARRRLDAFIERARAGNRRCVLVITGRGVRSGGVLRQMVPRWLGETPNRERVLAYADAQPRHGGHGALYVLLRRGRAG